MAKLCVGDIPIGAMNWIRTEEVPEERFGANLDTFIGKVDENGVLQKSTVRTALNLAGVTEIGNYALQYSFYGNLSITSVDLSSLQSVHSYGLYQAFSSCVFLTNIDLSSLQSVGFNSLYQAFYGCSNITSVDLSSLQSVDTYGLQSAFGNCSNVTSVNLSSLQSISSNGLQQTFSYCSKIVAVSFPALTDVQTNSFGTASYNGIFYNCTALTEIHFRADMQTTIEAMTGYDSKWGATSATIYFDL